jgi:hypothetical protein
MAEYRHNVELKGFVDSAVAEREVITAKIHKNTLWITDFNNGLFSRPTMTERISNDTPARDRLAISESVIQKRFNLAYVRNHLRLLREEYTNDPCIPAKYPNYNYIKMEYFSEKLKDIKKKWAI